jgi:hypothetical protein
MVTIMSYNMEGSAAEIMSRNLSRKYNGSNGKKYI